MQHILVLFSSFLLDLLLHGVSLKDIDGNLHFYECSTLTPTT